MRGRAGALGRRVVNLARHPLHRQRLALEAAVVLAGLKTMMTALPYARWRHLVVVSPGSSAGPLTRDQIADVVWAVDRVGRQLPTALNCLPRALAARVMLRWRGCEPALCIGVRREADATLEAHAWLEVQGEVVIGEMDGMQRFQRLQQWPRESR